jgi:hypothetical protein
MPREIAFVWLAISRLALVFRDSPKGENTPQIWWFSGLEIPCMCGLLLLRQVGDACSSTKIICETNDRHVIIGCNYKTARDNNVFEDV